MTRSTLSSYGSGTIQGISLVAGEFNKFAEHETPQYRIGHKIEDADGSVYRYAHYGADTNRGVLVSTDISESCMGDSNDAIVASASCSVTTDGTVGYHHFEVTGGDSGLAIVVDQFAGGKLIVSDDAGEGFTYDIVGNTANATDTSSFRVQLKQSIQVALTAASDFIIVGNKYSNLEIATHATDNYIAGVSCSTMDVSDKPFGWVQTKGVCGILEGTASVAGEKAILSPATSGATGTASIPQSADANSLDQIIGSCVVAGDSTGHGAYYINLE